MGEYPRPVVVRESEYQAVVAACSSAHYAGDKATAKALNRLCRRISRAAGLRPLGPLDLIERDQRAERARGEREEDRGPWATTL